jgi:hypothetical protein
MYMKKLPSLKLSKIKIRRPLLNYKKIAIRASVLGVVLLVVSGYLAYTRLYLSKDRRFWIAIENSMSTQSYVREITAGGTGNRTVEKTRYTFGPQATIEKLTSVGAKSATTESNVVTQTVATPSAQFVSYVDITTSEKKPNGDAYNFDSVKGVWARQAEATTQEEADQLKQDFVQQHVTIVPFGNLSGVARRNLLQELKSSGVYEIDRLNIVKQEIDGKNYMAYPVRVHLKKYVSILQKHFYELGYGTFSALDPSQYTETAKYNATLLLDMNGTTLRGMATSTQTELYVNYGTSRKTTIPTNAISLDDLQSRLQALQQ